MPIADKTDVAQRAGWYRGGSLDTTLGQRALDIAGTRAERKVREEISDSEYESVTASVADTSGALVSYDAEEYWRLQVGYDVGSGNIGLALHSPTDGDKDFDSGQSLESGWHHVAATFNSSRNDEVEILYDGSSVHTASVTDWGSGNVRYGALGVESGATSFRGSVVTGETESFGGRIDEPLYLVGRALTASEVSDLQGNPRLFADDSAATWKYDFEDDAPFSDITGNGNSAELQNGASLTTHGRYGRALNLTEETDDHAAIDHSHSSSGKTDNFTIACWVNAEPIERSKLREAEALLAAYFAFPSLNLRLTKKGGAQRRTGTVDNENDLMSKREADSYRETWYGDAMDLVRDLAPADGSETDPVYAI